VPLLEVAGIDELAEAVALGKSILSRNRSVGRPDITLFATEFHCYVDCSQDSGKDEPVRRSDVAQELAVLVNEASVRLDRAKEYLDHVENHFDSDLRHHDKLRGIKSLRSHKSSWYSSGLVTELR